MGIEGKAYLLLGIIAFSLCQASATKCYDCDNCPVEWDPKGVTIKEDCRQCMRTLSYFDGKVVFATRKCAPVCVEKDSVVLGQRAVVTCCNEDLCNTGSRSKTAVIIIPATMSSVLLALLT
ncbi:unnamed protein product [Dicrocoelium dendriticum]|nr:unnamed protein product [Dicrocoelium dendriticum]